MKNLLSNIPHTPGVYLMRNYAGEILYIGKANDLKKRISSHFSKSPLSGSIDSKLTPMLSQVKSVDYIILKSERDALLTENELIKKLKPKYNIIWRDDKSYPFVKLTDEEFPRIYLARQKKNRGMRVGGKLFGPYHNVGDVRHLLRYLRKVFGIRACKSLKKSQGCMYYHLKQCPAPCLNKISKTDYRKNINKVELFLMGKYAELEDQLQREMKTASNKLEFEKAAKLRDILHGIETMFEKVTFREIKLEDIQEGARISQALSELKIALQLKKLPITIEAFDVSNISGSNPTGSSVRFSYGRPDKDNYRRYKIKSVIGIDDYSMIQEIVKRRYSRLIREQQKLPNLVLIDGGKGHLSAAKKILDELKLNNLEIISIAKEKEEIYLPDKNEPVKLDVTSPALQFLRHIRDEAHRFAISYHRYRRKSTITKILILLFFIVPNVIANPSRESKYDDMILYHSMKNSVDPYLVRAIIKVESNFNPKCLSPKGAKGLMQLMPEICKMQGINDPYDPYQNIGAGTRHISILKFTYKDNLDQLLAAYNAGRLKVKYYNGIPPYEETKNFIKQVKRYYQKYKSENAIKRKKIYSFTDSKGHMYFFNE
ncbi:MAG: transglycosylase SLT domain-containing protein [Elusimicrobiota bacterium]|nr:transglycosylase SLT domain-containing protein [Elusimicrobiota bacterium]